MAKLVYQRKNGKWEARYHKGKSPDGKILYGTVYGDTEEEAIARRKEYLGYDSDETDIPAEMNLLILGSDIHGHDVKEIAESLRIFKKISFLDDFVPPHDDIIGKCAEAAQFRNRYPCAFVAIVDNDTRKKYTELLKESNFLLPSLVSHAANVSPKAVIGEGVAILPHCTVNEAVIGDFSIIDFKSLVNSGAAVGAYTRIDCGAIILRGANVPESLWVRSGEIFGTN